MNRTVFATAVAACLLLPSALTAQDEPWNRYTLDGLGGVYIQIDADQVCMDAGVEAADFEASTSLKLIEGEVGVLTYEEMLEHPALPELRVTLTCATGNGGGSMAYSVGLRVKQAAQMLRDTQISLPEAVTWYSTDVGVTTASAATSDIEAAVEAALDVFLEAWTAANGEGDEGGR